MLSSLFVNRTLQKEEMSKQTQTWSKLINSTSIPFSQTVFRLSTLVSSVILQRYTSNAKTQSTKFLFKYKIAWWKYVHAISSHKPVSLLVIHQKNDEIPRDLTTEIWGASSRRTTLGLAIFTRKQRESHRTPTHEAALKLSSPGGTAS